MIRFLLGLFTITPFIHTAQATELVIGEERVAPGIVYIFEGAIKDHIMPASQHLSQDNTHVHIEARANWGETAKELPEGTPPGGFIPYLKITAKITNENSGLISYVDLLPHINLIDNFHYARNIALPGAVTDTYSVTFNIIPPSQHDVALHKDWQDGYGEGVTSAHSFDYKNVNFEEIARATR